MSHLPAVLLLDDGELEDVHRQLERIGAEVRYLRGGVIPDRLEPPRVLFVTTPRHAHHQRFWPSAGRPVCIGVVSEDSTALRDRLRKSGFDFLVRRPIHPAALNMLLLRALYDGKERRRDTRHPVGHPVTVVRDGVDIQALLVDVSVAGARVLLPGAVDVAAQLQVNLPADLVGGVPFSVTGEVLRSVRKMTGDLALPFSISLSFGELPEEPRCRLEQAIEGLSGLPAIMPQAGGNGSTPRPDTRPPRRPTLRRHRPQPRVGSTERRYSTRVPFQSDVLAEDERGRRVVLGRDISKSGMRIESHPDLREDDRLRVTLYGEPGGEPISVRAWVVRDDRHEGFALRFEGLSEEDEKRLESFVAHLPAVEALREGEADSLGTVVSEIQEDLPGSP